MKTSFKRIALAVVASLGFGLLASTSPANAALDETLTLSASSATINLGETATVTITNTFVSEPLTATAQYSAANGQLDSRVVYVAGTSAGGSVLARLTTDSANIGAATTREVAVTTSGTPSFAESAIATAANTFTKATITLKFYQVATPGVYTYTITSRNYANLSTFKTATFTLTVTDTTAADRTKSKAYLTAPNGWTDAGALVQTNFLRSTAYSGGVGDVGIALGYPTADSTIVTSAGLPTASSGYVAKGILWVDLRNSSDTNIVYPGGTATAVRDSAVVTTSVGQLQTFARGAASGTFGKSVTIDPMTDTVVVYSDGSAGTAELNTYLGTSSTASRLIATKSVTFVGKAASFVVTETASVTAPNASLSAVRADSILSGTRIISFVAKDANGNNVDSAALNINSNFYCISSDSKVVTATGSTTLAHTTATYSQALGNWGCSMQVRDSGTATITVADSTTVASSTVTKASKTFTFAGAAWTGTIAFDKATYAPGEKALITLRITDRNGYTVANSANATNHNPFRNLQQSVLFSGQGKDGAGNDAGISGNTLQGITFPTINGIDTFVVLMPTYQSTVEITALTSYVDTVTNTPVKVSVNVVDPNAALIKAAQESADAATDAANEAIDAANAATDAANIAAEAADAATVAAEEARDAADAATAAVEELATQVATLMAALSAQVKTLANTVAKIAKKVKA